MKAKRAFDLLTKDDSFLPEDIATTCCDRLLVRSMARYDLTWTVFGTGKVRTEDVEAELMEFKLGERSSDRVDCG